MNELQLQSVTCCAGDEIENLEDFDNADDVILAYLAYSRHYRRPDEQGQHTPPFVLFSSKARNYKAQRLAVYIRRHGLGDVKGWTRHNPNTGNRVAMYLWSISRKGLAKHYARNKQAVDVLYDELYPAQKSYYSSY